MAKTGKKLLIFDEIQNIDQWDKLIRTLYEKERDIEIFLTGSNSELLSSEIGSNLAGRFIEIFVLPFNFKEYLAYQNIIINSEIDFYRELNTIKKEFWKFQKFGGLPEVFSIGNDNTKYSYLQGIISKVILDDIIQRFSVRQPLIIEKIIHYMHESVGNIVTATKLTDFINAEGLAIKNDTVTNYINYIVKTFAMYELDKFDWKQKRILNTNKKYYSVDTGLINLFKKPGNNYSKQLENIVFLKLKHASSTVYYGAMQGGKEIDFIVRDQSDIFYKYQICQTLTQNNVDREISAFVSADQYLNKMHNIVLTMDDSEEEIIFKECKIEKKNLLKWLLLA